MFDTIQIILWSITYMLIIAAGFLGWSKKKISMPYIPGVLNFSWECAALINSKGFYGHIIWLALDCLIIYIGFHFLDQTKQKIIYIISIVVLIWVQLMVFQLAQGMLISVFIIDLIMAICFCIDLRQISTKFKITIAITKLLGDMFAGLYYASEGIFVTITAILVFLINIFYLSLCFGEKK